MPNFKVSEEFPSRFLSGDEIAGKEIPVKIREIKAEAVQTKPGVEEDFLVVYFEGKQRGVKLGKRGETSKRAKELRKITGSDDTDGWVGHQVILYTESQKGFGDMLNVIHFKPTADIPEEDEIINYDEIAENIG